MKIFFWGDTRGDTGPANVNKGIVRNLTDRFQYVKSKNTCAQMLEAVVKCLRSDVAVISGVSRKGCILAFFARKTVYIMHGCAAREIEAEALTNAQAALRQERYLLKKADLLLPVSKKFAAWVRSAYPQYARKTGYLHPGIESGSISGQKNPGTIIAAGGDSAIKNNAVLALAVERMGGRAQLEVYGKTHHDQPQQLQHTRYMGAVSHGEFLQKLAETEVFVLNSVFETFSLAVIEALNCGCSVLVSEAAGVTEVLALEEDDIIHDPMDAEEIREKLVRLQEKPNNARLFRSLDLDRLSFLCCAERLENICAERLDLE